MVILAFEGFPLIVGWELTLACNLRCSHCGSSAGLPRDNELTLKESLDICDQFPNLLVQEVDFTGGEPLLRDDWHLIAGHLNDLGITTQLITNGLALDPWTISKIKEAGVRGVAISLDGLEATHDKIRGCKGLHSRVLGSMQLLHDEGIAVTAITTASALNINELPSILDLVISSGADCWQIQPIFPLGRVKASNELRLSEQEYIQLGRFIKEIGPKAEESGLRVSPADSCGYFTGLDERKPRWRGCNAGQVTCGIISDGKVKGCLSMPDELIEGDLRERDLWDIWFHPDSFAYTRRCSTEDMGPNCIGCDKTEECLGGCSSMSYGSTGSFHNDPYCFYGIYARNKQVIAQ